MFSVYLRVYGKSDEKSFFGTANSLQRVINDVFGFANPAILSPKMRVPTIIPKDFGA